MARRTLVAAFSAALLLGVPAIASAQDPAAAVAQKPDQYVFTQDSLMMGFTIAEAGAPEFEKFIAKVKETLQKSEKPERKQQAESWRLMKLETPPQGGNVSYFLVLEKVVKGASYDLFKILSEGLPPAEVQAIYDKVFPHIKAGISFTPIRFIG